MKSFSFVSPFELADFINKQLNVSEGRIEQLMHMGFQNRQASGIYKITVKNDEIKGETQFYQTVSEMHPEQE